MKLFLAGCDGIEFMIIAAASFEWRPKNERLCVLSSYYAMHPSMNPSQHAMFELSRELGYIDMIVDSGIFSMAFGAGRHQTYTEESLKAYTRSYLEAMHRVGFTGVVVEMDVHKVLGLASLAEMRKIMADMWPLERTIYAWHLEEGIDGLRAMVDRYPYISLSIPELRMIASKTGQDVIAMVRNLLTTIRKEPKGATVLVHLLGCTSANIMASPDYDTVDSTSWLAGRRWGLVNMIDAGGRRHAMSVTRDYRIPHNDEAVTRMQAEADEALHAFITKYGLWKHAEKPDTMQGLRKNWMIAMISAQSFCAMEQSINDTYHAAGVMRPTPFDVRREANR
jgi:hypothetical protein